MESFKLTQNIKGDVDQVFSSLLEDIRNNYLKSNISLEHTRSVLLDFVPRQVVSKSLLLLDDLLNYLSEDARNILDGQESSLINDFYDLNLALKIKDKFKESVDTNTLSFSTDVRIIYGGVAGGTVLATGGGLALTIAEGVLLKSLIGFGSVLAAVWVYKKVFDSSSPSAIAKLDSEVSEYINTSKNVTTDWLNSIILDYKAYFKEFCYERGISI